MHEDIFLHKTLMACIGMNLEKYDDIVAMMCCYVLVNTSVLLI